MIKNILSYNLESSNMESSNIESSNKLSNSQWVLVKIELMLKIKFKHTLISK